MKHTSILYEATGKCSEGNNRLCIVQYSENISESQCVGRTYDAATFSGSQKKSARIEPTSGVLRRMRIDLEGVDAE